MYLQSLMFILFSFLVFIFLLLFCQPPQPNHPTFRSSRRFALSLDNLSIFMFSCILYLCGIKSNDVNGKTIGCEVDLPIFWLLNVRNVQMYIKKKKKKKQEVLHMLLNLVGWKITASKVNEMWREKKV